MPLALNATDNLDGTVDLDVTGAAAAYAPLYVSDFDAGGIDGWAGGTTSGGAPSIASQTPAPDGSGIDSLWVTAGFDNTGDYVRRSFTVTATHKYRVIATLMLRSTAPVSSVGVLLYTNGNAYAEATVGKVTPITVTYDFVAAAGTELVDLRLMLDQAAHVHIHMWNVSVRRVPLTLDALVIQRTDANGTRYVRLPAGAEPDVSGALSVVDVEHSLAPQLITYTVRDGAGATATDTLTPAAGALPILSAVGYSAELLEVPRVDGYTEAREYTQAAVTVHEVIGRGDPLTSSRDDFAWSGRKGTLTFPAADYAAAQAIAQVYRTGRVTLLRQATHPGLDLYHVAERVRVEPAALLTAGWSWTVSADYLECGWPEGDMRGATDWTYGELADTVLAYWNVAADWSTYADLAAGP